ncbi:unnamed protein product [Linum trigynum]|uniref:Uncharacterized protein n=2 Tax=Linum trigynum TaxID=586398 RepID=A0AAV2DSI8_9ROSI
MNSSRSHKALARLLEVPYTASDFIDWGDHMTPTLSPKRDISGRWRKLHGIDDWDNFLDPIDPTLRCEILKYGEFASATYDAFDFDPEIWIPPLHVRHVKISPPTTARHSILSHLSQYHRRDSPLLL